MRSLRPQMQRAPISNNETAARIACSELSLALLKDRGGAFSGQPAAPSTEEFPVSTSKAGGSSLHSLAH